MVPGRAGRAKVRLAKWWRGLLSLTWGERWILVVALVLNPFFRVVLRRRGTSDAARLVDRFSHRRFEQRRPVSNAEAVALGRSVGTLVNRAAAEPAPAVTCLARSMTAQMLLRRRGVEAALKIGVRRDELGDQPPADGSAPLLFHAWVEVDHVPVNDSVRVGEVYAAFPLEGLSAIVRAS